MSDVNLKCVSLANGVLSPDLRMNYEFGLVLGVDEFRQEQLYFLEKDYLHNRALHGYGTVYGLQVRLTRPPDNDREALVTVEPGLGIDQWGRPFLLRDAQCARLGAWLAAQEQQTPGSVAAHQGLSGDMHVYVVAAYDTCDDALVPIAGQPCASSDSAQAPSRIRDSYNIEIRWDPPAMPAWEAVRRFARLLAQVRLEPGLLPSDSDEPAITALVRGLDQPGPFDLPADIEPPASPPNTPPGPFRLPAESAREALDRIFTVWVTEVRPRIAPDLSDPSGTGGGAAPDPAILLARLDFVPALPFDARNPSILDPLAPVDEGRPFLLHTGLIQELLLLGNGEVAARPEREFATIRVVDGRTLRAWVHHPVPLDFLGDPRGAFTLVADGAPLDIAEVTPLSDNVFGITVDDAGSPPGALIAPGARVELGFGLASFYERNGGPLLPALDALPYAYVGRTGSDGGHIVAFTVAPSPPQAFVTFSTALGDNGQPGLHAWFHVPGGVQLPEVVTAFRQPGDQEVGFAARPAGGAGFVADYILSPTGDNTLGDGEEYRFAFDTRTIRVGPDDKSLAEAMREAPLAFLDYDGRDTIAGYAVVDLPPQPQQTGLSWDDILRLPTVPFVTITAEGITPTPDGKNRGPTYELWFHLDLDPRKISLGLGGDQPVVVILAEEPESSSPAEPPRLIEFPSDAIRWQRDRHNVFRMWLTPQGLDRVRNSPYLRLLFPKGANKVVDVESGDGRTLEEFIKADHVKFEGDTGGEFIVAYIRGQEGQG